MMNSLLLFSILAGIFIAIIVIARVWSHPSLVVTRPRPSSTPSSSEQETPRSHVPWGALSLKHVPSVPVSWVACQQCNSFWTVLSANGRPMWVGYEDLTVGQSESRGLISSSCIFSSQTKRSRCLMPTKSSLKPLPKDGGTETSGPLLCGCTTSCKSNVCQSLQSQLDN